MQSKEKICIFASTLKKGQHFIKNYNHERFNEVRYGAGARGK